MEAQGPLGLRVRGERYRPKEGPRAGIRSGILEPFGSNPDFFPQPSILCLYIRGQLGSWQPLCPNPPKLPITPKYAGVPSLALSTCPLPTSGPPCYPCFRLGWVPHYLTQTYRTVTSSPLLQFFLLSPLASPRAPSPPLGTHLQSPQHSGLAQDSLGDSSQLCLHLAPEVHPPCTFLPPPLVPLMAWGRQDGRLTLRSRSKGESRETPGRARAVLGTPFCLSQGSCLSGGDVLHSHPDPECTALGPAPCLGSGLCSQSNLQCLVLLVPGPAHPVPSSALLPRFLQPVSFPHI